ncbi:MAG: STAS/SEC14 domain-containing protein [Hymenobacter sp.]|nr:MAG: STAS/SEC14 domain-containing protein [Hymenobacter sp.]
MKLHLLRQTKCLDIYYDSGNDWLFLDWRGDLTLQDAKDACVALAHCHLQRPYPRILNSNAQLEGVSWSVAAWLVTDFLPHMSLAGVEHVAWICSPTLSGRHVVQTIVNWLPGFILNTFFDIEDAVDWLQHTRSTHPQGYTLSQRPPAEQAKLVQVVQELSQRAAPRSRLKHV